MPKHKIRTLTEQAALEQIVETVQQAETGEAPFALVLGSGFSRGLVPTTNELVNESLPLWVKSLNDGKSFESKTEVSADQRAGIAQTFWKEFAAKNLERGLNLALDSTTGLPEDYAEAYSSAFAPEYTGAVGKPAQARRFQRALMQLNKPRLNTAHFLLASLLAVQPGKTAPRNNLFKARAAFCRLILTTNFDPFLQTALQVVNQLYFMSDTPRLGVPDEIYDDQTEAIHLVYLHGSIHRRDQAATKEAIDDIKKKNADILKPILERRGVIVLGYSGWDDAIVEALVACDEFDNLLYWCGLEPDPLTKGAFGPRVAEILYKSTAAYVQSVGAGYFMSQLCLGLVEGAPRLIGNPIGQLKDLLDVIDLKDLEEIKPPPSSGLSAPQLPQSMSRAKALVQEKQRALELLEQAEKDFLEKFLEKKIEPLLSSAQLALSLGNYEECLKRCNEALALKKLEPLKKAQLLMLRGLANYYSGHADAAVTDWSEIIILPDAPIEQVAQALINRGVTQGSDNAKAIADYTQVIEQVPDVPVGQLAQAIVNRGVTLARSGDTENALADFNRVIEQLPGAPVEQMAKALVGRGWSWDQKRDIEKAIADYTRVIDQLVYAPVEQMAEALFNRGVAWGKENDNEKAIADYTRVIEQLPGAPVERVAGALVNRGLAWGQQGDLEKAIVDYTRVIEQLAGLPLDQLAQALVGRGWSWAQKSNTEKAIADYTRVIEQLPDAPVAQVAQALVGRGVISAGKGDTGKAIADYSRVIEQLPGAPVEHVAQALVNRGIARGEMDDTEKAIADYTRVIEQLPGAPTEQVAQALINRAIAWGKKGNTEKAMADYKRIMEQLPGVSIQYLAQAQASLGWWNYQANHFADFLSDTEAALSKQPTLDFATFNLGLALLASERDEDALAAYRAAGEKFPEAVEALGLVDLREASKKWLTKERAKPAIQLLESLRK